MWNKLLTPLRTLSVVLACVAVVAAASCTNHSSPTEPSQQQQTPPQNTPPPSTQSTANVNVTIKPNPVPFSGQPITDAASCAGSPNTWFYDQVFEETAGVSVHITHRNDSFDGRVTNDGSADMTVPAKGTMTIHSRWCSTAAVSHTAQTTFTGTDANGHTINMSGGQVQLRSK